MPRREGFLREEDLAAESFGLVISCSVFEHVRSREPLDEMVSLLGQNGVLGVHTVVCEQVPRDKDWFYYLPVHCAFFTNESMRRLCKQWGFRSSFYLLPARLWFLCKQPLEQLPREVRQILEGEDWSAKNGFMDFWRQD